jgi:hypothetical protein
MRHARPGARGSGPRQIDVEHQPAAVTLVSPVTAGTLEYSVAKSRHFRRVGSLAVVAAIALAAGAAKLARPIWSWGESEWHYRGVLRYSPPPNTVVYTTDPAEGSRLLKQSSEYRVLARTPRGVDIVTLRPALLSRYTNTPEYSGAAAFLHGRCSRRGWVAAVGIELRTFTHFEDCVFFDAWVLRRPTRPFLPIPGPNGHKLPPHLWADPRDVVRVFAGVPDPADESKFSITLEVNGVRNTVSGRLRDDDLVELWPDTGRLVYFNGRLDAAWSPDGSYREPSGLDIRAAGARETHQ